jgi:hypothetical protein
LRCPWEEERRSEHTLSLITGCPSAIGPTMVEEERERNPEFKAKQVIGWVF